MVQLNDVMDTMLERAGVENEEYAGPTQVIAKIKVTSWLSTCTLGVEGLDWNPGPAIY